MRTRERQARNVLCAGGEIREGALEDAARLAETLSRTTLAGIFGVWCVWQLQFERWRLRSGAQVACACWAVRCGTMFDVYAVFARCLRRVCALRPAQCATVTGFALESRGVAHVGSRV